VKKDASFLPLEAAEAWGAHDHVDEAIAIDVPSAHREAEAAARLARAVERGIV
jgi:hypothetical protein